MTPCHNKAAERKIGRMFEYLITRPLGWIIEMIYSLVANYGLAIIIFTVIVKLILLPLNIKSQKAMRKQQKIQPILQELQKKYANDQEKLNREMMKPVSYTHLDVYKRQHYMLYFLRERQTR